MAKGQKKGWLHCPPEQKQKKKKREKKKMQSRFRVKWRELPRQRCSFLGLLACGTLWFSRVEHHTTLFSERSAVTFTVRPNKVKQPSSRRAVPNCSS